MDEAPFDQFSSHDMNMVNVNRSSASMKNKPVLVNYHFYHKNSFIMKLILLF